MYNGVFFFSFVLRQGAAEQPGQVLTLPAVSLPSSGVPGLCALNSQDFQRVSPALFRLTGEAVEVTGEWGGGSFADVLAGKVWGPRAQIFSAPVEAG